MKNERLTMKPPEKDVVTTPLESGDLNEQTAGVEGKLTDEERQLLEHSTQLLKMVARARRRDALDKEADGTNMVPVLYPAVSANLALMLLDLASPTVTAATSVGVLAPLLTTVSSARRPTTLHLAEGHDIQCLRVAEQSDAIVEGRVVLAVHPRGVGVGEEAVAMAKQRMAEVLEVISLASERAKDGDLGAVLIPESVTQFAGLSLEGSRSYAQTVAEITADPPKVPYDDNEKAIIIPIDQVAGIIERLKGGDSALTNQILEELSRRNPGAGSALSADNPNIVKALHGILHRLAYSEGRITRWQKDMETIEGTEVWAGTRSKVSEDLTPTLITHDPYNPRLIYRSSQTGQEVSNQDLRTLTGGDAFSEDITVRLEEGMDDMVLIRMALELMEKSTQTDEVSPRTDEESASMSEKSSTPRNITVGNGVDRWKYRRRNGAKILLGSLAVFGVLQGGGLVSDALEQTEGTKRGVREPQLFRVENHGLDQQSSYWGQETSYKFEGGQWTSVEMQQERLKIPQNLKQKDVPHMTVKTKLGVEDLALPIEDGTQLGALRAYNVHRDEVDVDAYRFEDGVIAVDVDGNDETKNAYLEYDLIAGKGSGIHAERSIAVSGEMYKSEAWKETFDDASEGAAYVRDTFIYDDNDALKTELSHQHSPSDYADRVFDTARCQCLQCNTHVALMESQVRPEQKLALVSGFLHPRKNDETRSYLVEGHAWLNDGKTIDATAGNTDEKSTLPSYDPPEVLDKTWDKQVEQPLKKVEERDEQKRTALWSLFGAAALGLAVLEARYRPLRNAGNVILDIDRRTTAELDLKESDALRLMGWQAYGKWESRVPAVGEKENRETVPAEANIPEATLVEIAQGGFRASGQLTASEQRGLRRTAAAILHARRKNK